MGAGEDHRPSTPIFSENPNDHVNHDIKGVKPHSIRNLGGDCELADDHLHFFFDSSYIFEDLLRREQDHL